MSNPPPPEPRTINANPGVCTPTIVPDWFVDPPAQDKFTDRAGNSITLLNCGEYLTPFYAALQGATQSIWIAIWGFDSDLSLVLDSKEEHHKISSVLEERADRGVQVKLLVWRSPSDVVSAPSISWISRQRDPIFRHKNIQYKVRSMPTGISDERYWLRPWREDSFQLAEEYFGSHHQKMVLIDHTRGREAIGFVQGANFKPEYFDRPSHPWRKDGKGWQEVGLVLKGPCLIDLFHNFKEGWNMSSSLFLPNIDEAPPTIPAQGTHSAQILRTWRFTHENNIYNFCIKAFRSLNHFLYVEDQYFRMPEFVERIMARAKEIVEESNHGKRLHLFVLTNPNKDAMGEANMRQTMLHELNRRDTDLTSGQMKPRYEKGEVFDSKAIEAMERQGVKVHVCCLKNYTTQSVRGNMTGEETYNPSMKGPPLPIYKWSTGIVYNDVYVHAKLSILDDAYVLLGSANWHARGMTNDSELNIAVQCHDQIATEFREKLWREHTNRLWQPVNNAQGCFDVEKSFDRWTDLLSQNMKAYAKGESLIMNLFPLFEDLEKLKMYPNQWYG